MFLDEDHFIVVPQRRMRAIEFAVRNDGTIPGKDIYDSLSKQNRAWFLEFCKYIADNGEQAINNEDHFRHKEGPIYSIQKTMSKPEGGKGRIRFPCFRLGNRWIITHGFWKPAQRFWPPTQMFKAKEIMSEIIERENQNSN